MKFRNLFGGAPSKFGSQCAWFDKVNQVKIIPLGDEGRNENPDLRQVRDIKEEGSYKIY